MSGKSFIGKESWQIKEKYIQNKLKLELYPNKQNKNIQRESWEIIEYNFNKNINYTVKGVVLSEKK
tara:strand:- start:180 stop:377 length:198 start_codon:yes stop_codon:yes gene_type:complete